MKRALVLLLLTGCSAPERPWELPWPRAPVVEVERQKSLLDGKYPIDLVTTLRLAGANNLDLAYVREKVQEAWARSEMADERFWPVVGPELAFRRHEGLTQATDGSFVDVDKQQFFIGGRLRLRWEVGDALFASFAASRRYDASLESLRATEGVVLLDAGLAYFDLLREQLRLRALDQSIEISERLEKELDTAVQAGRGFRGDVLRARVQASSGRLARERAQELLRLASIRLGSMLRLAPGIELVAVEDDLRSLTLVASSMPEEDLIRESFENRAEIREVRRELEATSHERTGSKWGPLIPELQVEAAPGWLGPVPSELESTGDYAFTLGWRIGPGGLFDSGRQRLADSRVRQAGIQLERVRQRVVDEVRSARTQLGSKEKTLEIARQELKDAEEALKLNQERQAASVGLPLEVIQAEDALTRARIDLYTALVEYNQAQLRLRFALGRRP